MTEFSKIALGVGVFAFITALVAIILVVVIMTQWNSQKENIEDITLKIKDEYALN